MKKYLLSITSKLKDLNSVVHNFVDKFSSNPAFSFVIAVALAIFIYVGVANFTKK